MIDPDVTELIGLCHLSVLLKSSQNPQNECGTSGDLHEMSHM